MSVHMLGVIPAKAGIQGVSLNSGQKHAGMMNTVMDTLSYGPVLRLHSGASILRC